MTDQWHELSTTAALPGLYLRAARKRKISGTTLPTTGLRCSLEVNAERLAAYRTLCHFGDDPLLPATWPHVMAFPLQLQLLTANDFPFPLPGLVHLSNSIHVIRPLGGVTRLHFAVRVDNLQAHEKGATFDLITEARDGLGLLWSETSRMLCRGVKLPGEPACEPEAEALPLSELTRWYANSNIGRRYARLCGDYNPIHLSAASAKLFGLPTAIAHGLWLEARTLAALNSHLPAANVEITVDFKKPVRLPAEVILHSSEAGSSGDFQLNGHADLVHMVGRWRPLS